MISRIQKVQAIVFIAFLLSITACKKGVSVSNPEIEKLYGTWDWVQSSGGLSGGESTPSSVGYTQTIEFNKNGTYKKFKNGQQESQLVFTISEGSTIYSSENTYLINYTNTGVSHSNNNLTKQSMSFGGQDTLFLNDECYDCYGHIYTRKK